MPGQAIEANKSSDSGKQYNSLRPPSVANCNTECACMFYGSRKRLSIPLILCKSTYCCTDGQMQIGDTSYDTYAS